MVKLDLFFRHLKRFFRLFRTRLKEGYKNFLLELKPFAREIAVQVLLPTVIVGLLICIFGLVFLSATILTTKWLYFRDDFQWKYVINVGSFTSLLAVAGAAFFFLLRGIKNFFKRVWHDSSTKGVARELWE